MEIAKTFTISLSADIHASGTDAGLFRAARRIVINSEVLKAAKISAGDALVLSKADNANVQQNKVYAVGIAWPAADLSQDDAVISHPLLLTAQILEGDRVHLFPLNHAKLPPGLPNLRHISEAGTVHFQECSVDDNIRISSVSPQVEKTKHRDWLTLLVREALVGLKYITPTQCLDAIYEGKKRRFKLVSASEDTSSAENALASDLNSLSIHPSAKLWTATWDTQVVIAESKQPSSFEQPRSDSIQVVNKDMATQAYNSVGGLDKQIALIRDLIEIPLTRPELFHHFGLKPPRGVLLHGPPGTGKTHLARAIAASTNSSVIIINGPELSSAYHGETESKLRDVFAEARARSPCIIVLDEVDAICPRREDGPGGEVEKRVVAQLLTIMDGMEDQDQSGRKERVVVVATTNRPNAIDPALRRPGRFDREIEVGIPDVEARRSILEVLLRKTPHSLSSDDILSLASKAHGYVGADLSAVVREAGTAAIKRWIATDKAHHSAEDGSTQQLQVTLSDLLASLTSVRPSGLRSLFLDTIPVRYADIGGQSSNIQKLKECIEWPLMHPEAFHRLGVRPPKGVLLYGPPGCSKTLLVRACATESGVNFVAVKGPELLNKFVGESERAVREIFRKARAASPAIIFFDEIDALATSRSASETGGASHEGVLTSLLNEMDGVQELVGVTVVAATNRPDVIDSALMRPGRLDRILYVGPPDRAGREEILRIRMNKMSVEPGVDVGSLADLTDGCSGAEIAALCQEAALITMKQDINSPYVSYDALTTAAKTIKRQITEDVIQRYHTWRDRNGLSDM